MRTLAKTYRKNIPVLDRSFENNNAYLAELSFRMNTGRSVTDYIN